MRGSNEICCKKFPKFVKTKRQIGKGKSCQEKSRENCGKSPKFVKIKRGTNVKEFQKTETEKNHLFCQEIKRQIVGNICKFFKEKDKC